MHTLIRSHCSIIQFVFLSSHISCALFQCLMCCMVCLCVSFVCHRFSVAHFTHTVYTFKRRKQQQQQKSVCLCVLCSVRFISFRFIFVYSSPVDLYTCSVARLSLSLTFTVFTVCIRTSNLRLKLPTTQFSLTLQFCHSFRRDIDFVLGLSFEVWPVLFVYKKNIFDHFPTG